ncbi:spore germination protein [Aneurinibacillus thermoaerophilus]|uniref:spore germination protein n=1 Tax=Aneurinibacillus thermoaerophilus TaxID=143495 RepID=UPI002E1FE424|nr:spore germination protein [Aneurinibacillus thermoaerophilus]
MKMSQLWRKKARKSKQWLSQEKAAISSIPLQPLHTSLEKNVQDITEQLGQNTDFTSHHLICAGRRVALFFFQSLVDIQHLSEYVILPLQERWDKDASEKGLLLSEEKAKHELLQIIQRQIVATTETQRIMDWQAAIQQMLDGKALLIVDGEATGLAVGVERVEKRNIANPDTEQSVIGPKESFIEDLDTNITLIRQRLRDPKLTIEVINITKRGKHKVCIFYLEDVANPSIIEEVKRRLFAIDTDIIQGQMHLQELIEDNSFSLFPELRPTERPDVVCSYLLEGNVVVMTGNSSHALILPITFFQLLDTVDDYYSSWQYATLIRFVRMLALLFSIVIPGLYLSLTAFNPELIPTRLVISMDAARTKVALPILMEIFAMEIMIEILREAGVKLPKPIGQAVSIIGGLVIGEAAVNANLVSPVTIVIIALTTISSFTAPVYLLGITYRILRFFVLFCSSILGLYGLILGLFFIHAHTARLVSFGVPYLAPLSPLRIADWKDTLVRFPFKKLTKRPSFLNPLQRSKSKPLPMISRKQHKKKNKR